MNDLPAPQPREPEPKGGPRTINLRQLERRVLRLMRGAPSLALAQAMFEHVEALMILGEEEETLAELGALAELLEGLTDPPARRMLAELLGHRVRYTIGLSREDLFAGALEDALRALALLGEEDELPDELRELEAELMVHRGHLLLLLERDEALSALRRAVEQAERLGTPRGPQLQLQARRELAVALAPEDPIAALRELERAERLLDQLPQARNERALILSTRAELLGQAGRIQDALAVLAAPGIAEEDWAVLQRAATLDLAGRPAEAFELGERLLERLREELDPEDLSGRTQLAELLLMQARRAPDDELRGERAAEAVEVLETISPLPLRCRRLASQALELRAAAEDPDDAHESLMRRAQLLEALVREHGAEQDRIELVRTYLLDGDALMRTGDPQEARRRYTDAVREFDHWSRDHTFVRALLPLAKNALAHALAACGLWIAAQREAEVAVESISFRIGPAALADMGEVFLFRAVASLNLGDAEGAVAGLSEVLEQLLEVVLKDGQEPPPSSLYETVINLCVLRAEILVDHLDRVDEAADSYDQALTLCELGGGRPQLQGAILGAKAAMLNERDRPAEALPLLQRCLELFTPGGALENGDKRELALALVNMASTLNRMGEPRTALGRIQEADQVLGPSDEAELEDDEEDEDELEDERRRRDAIKCHLFQQRGEALLRVGHPLLAADELTRAIDLCRGLLDGDGDPRYDAQQRLPLALLRRAHCWIAAGGDHAREASDDLREARQRFVTLFEDEGRPEHRRRLAEVETLEQALKPPE